MKIEAAARLVLSDKWSAPITEKVEDHPPEGLFTKSSNAIARGLKKLHPDLKGASSALSFYLNRAGKNLSDADRKRVEGAREKLKDLYGEKE
jgi:hypothetical protein